MYEYEFNGKVLIPTPIGEVDLNGINGISVKSFGAKGNGIDDDTKAIQNAINMAVTKSKVLYFPAGTYLCNIELKGRMTIFGDGRINTVLKSFNKNLPVVNTKQTSYNNIRDMDIVAGYDQVAPLLDMSGSRYIVLDKLRVFQLPNSVGQYSYSAIGIDNRVIAPATWVGYNRIRDVSVLYCSYGLLTGGGLNSVLSLEDCMMSTNGYYNIYLDGVSVCQIRNQDCAAGGKLAGGTLYDPELYGGLYVKGSNIDISAIWYEYNNKYIAGSIIPNNCYIHPESNNVHVNAGRENWSNSDNILFKEKEIKSRNTRQVVPMDSGIGKGKPLNLIPNSQFKYLGASNVPISWSRINATVLTPVTLNLPAGIEDGIKMTGIGGTCALHFNLFDSVGNNGVIKDISKYIGQDIVFSFYFKAGVNTEGRAGFNLASGSQLTTGSKFISIFNTEGEWIKVIQRHKIIGTENKIYCQFQITTLNAEYEITQAIAALDDHVIDTGGVTVTEHGGNILSQEFKIGGCRHGFGTAIPTTGAWLKGDIVYNINPSAAGYVGWICVTAGTPGTWKGFGLIQA